MNNKLFITYTIISLFACSCMNQLFAQCPATPPLGFTFESTESRCESNGTITLHITGGNPFVESGTGNLIYNNTIISPFILPIGGQADSIFNALASGAYIVEVEDACGTTVTHQVIVPGTHMQLELTPTFSDATCDGLGGGWICGTPDEGRPWPPGYYQYQLFDASTNPATPLGPIGLDSCFTNLAAGSYQIRAYDSCNNFQTRDVILAATAYGPTFYYADSWFYQSCDTGCVRIYTYLNSGTLPWGEFPFQWEIIAADTNVSELLGVSGQFDGYYEYDTLCYTPLFANARLTIQVTDACGRVATRSVYLDGFNVYGYDRFSCSEGAYIYTTTNYTRHCPAGSMLFEMTSVPPGAPIPPPQDTGYWTGLESGQYCYRVTECCGNVFTRCVNVDAPNWTAFLSESVIYTCSLGVVGFRLRYASNGGPAPTSAIYEIISAPLGYTGQVRDTFNYNALVEGPPGEYCFIMWDECLLRRDTHCQNLTNPLYFNHETIVTPGCVTGNSIETIDSTNATLRYYLYRLTPTFQLIESYTTNTLWNNLVTGTYRLDVRNIYAGCNIVQDTIVIPEYEPPQITGAWGIDCDNGTGLITVAGSGGNTPYTYELFQGPVTRPLQSTPTFPGLPSGTYDIRLNDNCNNSAVQTVAIEPFDPSLKGYGGGTFCAGDTVNLFVDSLAVGIYTWSGPNGFTSANSSIDFNGLTLADAGNYSVLIEVQQPSQTSCVSDTINFSINVLDCSCTIAPFTATMIDCNGNGNGSATANINSATGGPFTYVWSNGANTQTINNLAPGNYAVTITDATGCSATGDTTITQPPTLTLTGSSLNASCNGASTGIVNITPGGGITMGTGCMGYSFLWSNGATTQNLMNVVAGNYSVTVTDCNDCTIVRSYSIGQPSALTLSATTTNVSCNGASNASINTTPGGGTTSGSPNIPCAGYTYSWSNNATTQDLNNLGPGTYTLTVTDCNGCTIVRSYVISQPTIISIGGSSLPLTCNSGSDGAVNILPAGGTLTGTTCTGYTYSWSNGATTQNLSNLTAGTYTVTVTDCNGCSSTRLYTVIEPPVLTVSGSLNHPSCASEDTGTIDLTVTGGNTCRGGNGGNLRGNLDCTFLWSNGETTQNLTGLAGGTYTVTVTDCKGCTATASFMLNTPPALTLTAITSNVSCNMAANGNINITPGGGTVTGLPTNPCPGYSYLWSTGATSQDLNNIGAGAYTVTVTDCNRCTIVRSYNISEPVAISIGGNSTSTTCNGGAEGSISVIPSGGTLIGTTCTGYSYLWSNNATTQNLSNLTPGTYTVTVSDCFGCAETRSFIISEPAAISIVGFPTPLSCNNDSTGRIDLFVSGGNICGPSGNSNTNTFLWSNGATSPNIFGLTAGTYVVTVSDCQGCTATASYTLTNPPALTLSATILDASSCDLMSLGQIQLTPGGGGPPIGTGCNGFEYLWSNGSTSQTLSAPIGTYTVTVTDCNDCEITGSYTIAPPPPIIITGTVDSELCAGGQNGSISLSVSGGPSIAVVCGGTVYDWSANANGATTPNISGLGSGTYTVTVTMNPNCNSCSETASFVINASAGLTCTVNGNDVDCHNGSNGSAAVSVNGGTGPYTYAWEKDGTAISNTTYFISNLMAGMYTSTVTDASGCSAICSVMISQPTPLMVGLCGAACEVSCYGQSDGSICVLAQGGVLPYSYTWNDGQTTQTATGLPAGNYMATVTDGNGCTATLMTSIMEPPADCDCFDPNDPTALDICAELMNNPMSPIGSLDCDNGGVDNATECANGGDPNDPSDDCDLWQHTGENLCDILMANPNHPLATVDCDNGGVSNQDECNSGEDPFDPTDDCQSALDNAINICAIVLNDPTGMMANQDCDDGGVINITECENGGDPSDPSDDCEVASNVGVDICTMLDPDGDGTFDSSHPWASLDCDQGGVINITECITGDDPNDPSDDPQCLCEEAMDGGIDICALLAADPMHPMGTLDCDNGGVMNHVECSNMGDPLDPIDDCDLWQFTGMDICIVLAANPNHPLADVDCDHGGVSNIDECSTGDDPFDPMDDCQAAEDNNIDICGIILSDPTVIISTMDCDNGGVTNMEECQNGGDPLDPNDDCHTASTAGWNICTLLDPDGDGTFDPTIPWATLDCDDGGVSNIDECIAGTDPNDPSDDPTCACHDAEIGTIDVCDILAADPTNPLGTLDCDKGGIDNQTECNNNGDPLDPMDDCAVAEDASVDICTLIANNPQNPLATQDCDDGGVMNYVECNNGEDPFDPTDDCQAALDEGLNICVIVLADPTGIMATMDCDEGGVDNITECNNGGDPSDPTDDCDAAANAGMNICMMLDPDGDGTFDNNHPWATLDCDDGGVINITECITGNDPTDPSDDPQCLCDEAMSGGIDICALLTADPSHAIGTLDCDDGGVMNHVECSNNGDPLDPNDDCDQWQYTGMDLCIVLATNPDHPLADADCDDGGVTNMHECTSSEDPFDPTDDCQSAIDNALDICAIVLSDPTGMMATLDCDNGGVTNIVECQNGGDPTVPEDDCHAASNAGMDICTMITANPTHPWASLDCDDGGVSNADECLVGGDPNDPIDDQTCDPCDAAENGSIDICAILVLDPGHELASVDCDGGGVLNQTECANGTDPNDPNDDCSLVNDGTLDVCTIINADPSNPLATADCDNGGVTNQDECDAGTDPTDPSDDCDAAINGGLDICILIGADLTHPLATMDCDDGGVSNYDECTNGGNPSDPTDDCESATEIGMDICLILDGNGDGVFNPNHPWATLDCDQGGVSNIDECIVGTDPNDPSDDPTCACHDAEMGTIDICAILTADPTNPIGTLDCDEGGLTNAEECEDGGDPLDPSDECDVLIAGNIDVCLLLSADPNNPLATQDCDNGGVTNMDECNSSENPEDPADDCQSAIDQGLDICILIGADPMHPLGNQDCDNGGVSNYDECMNGGDPADPADDCYTATDINVAICAVLTSDPSHPWATMDCDHGGISNYEECMDGTDPNEPSDDLSCPSDPCVDAENGVIDVCEILNSDPNHPVGTLDCDGGGTINSIECNNGGNPLDQSDDCEMIINAGVDICAMVILDPTGPLAEADCDNGGVSNIDECNSGEDPTDPADDCQSAMDNGLDICAIVLNDPTGTMATMDCDNGGVDNITECQNGGNPTDPTDDCHAAADAGMDICTMITNNPNHPWTTLDCDDGGVDNYTECLAGNDPNDPIDDGNCPCHDASSGTLDICLILSQDPRHPLGTLDCDEGGIINLVECTNGNDPNDPDDECDLVTSGDVDVCAILTADPDNPLGPQDCDNGGVSNIDECNNGGNPSDPVDDCDTALNGGLNICILIGADPTHPLANADCDNGGVSNYHECMNSGNPSDPTDDCYPAVDVNMDICAMLVNNPNWSTMDCDHGGMSNGDECLVGGDPSDPVDDQACDPCETVGNNGMDICVVLAGNPNHPLATEDCDEGGMNNQTECDNGGDPNDPADDCTILELEYSNACIFIINNPDNPLATADCDNGGVSNIDECNTGEDPFDPTDDCQSAIDGNLDICVMINGNPTHPLATLDCDNGGIANNVECDNGADPNDPADDCQAAIVGDVDICAIINGDPSHPWASLDCDNGGIMNFTECISGEDPSDPIDDCQTVLDEEIDLCALINADPNHPLATADCDSGGAMNIKECYHGQDPLDPSDDCETIILAEMDICAIVLADPTHPLATQDCDNGGIINIIECNTGGDPNEPSDDVYCTADNPCDELGGSEDICAILAGDPAHPLATGDCDNGGVDNQTECDNGGDPWDASDDCDMAIAGNVDICIVIGGDPTHPLATLDCDDGGVPNIDECYTGDDPLDPSDDCQAAIDGDIDLCAILINPDGTYHPLATLDCDNGGVPNINECLYGYNPEDASDECEAALGCGLDICVLIDGDPNHPLADLDCDNGGVPNYIECMNNGDPGIPSDDCQVAIAGEIDVCLLICSDPTHPLSSLDCDNGGISNHVECVAGTNPNDPGDDCLAALETGIDICTIIAFDPNSPYASQDCDNGGIDNGTECANGGDPGDPTDDCLGAIATGEDVCAIINGDPAHPMSSLDCDAGGVDNYTECTNGTDPAAASDDCSAAKNAGLNVCVLIGYDINHPLATQDCDNGGVDNFTECANAGDPCDPIDDCETAATAGMDICGMLAADPNHPWASLDCDRGGVDNQTECNAGNDPTDPSDDQNSSGNLCTDAMDGNSDICAMLTADPTHPIGLADCDNGGIANSEECLNGNDPTDDLDDCPDLTPITTILPGNIAGVSGVGVAVEISELNGIDTDGSAIYVRIPSDPRLTFVWDPALTSVALTTVNNTNWTYLGNNGVVHTFRYNGLNTIVLGRTTEAFGFQSTYDPQATDGQTTVTATIVPFGGGECNILNDTDSERLVYFE